MVRLVVRRLPVGTEDVTTEDAKVQYSVPGKKSKRRGLILGRVYLTCSEDVVSAVTARLTTGGGVVERAAFEKVFRNPKNRDKRQNTWRKSCGLADFVAWEARGRPVQDEPEVEPTASHLVDFINQRGSLFGKGGKMKRRKGRTKANECDDLPKDDTKTAKRKKKDRSKKNKAPAPNPTGKKSGGPKILQRGE